MVYSGGWNKWQANSWNSQKRKNNIKFEELMLNCFNINVTQCASHQC